jgi:hypothetical protein
MDFTSNKWALYILLAASVIIAFHFAKLSGLLGGK